MQTKSSDVMVNYELGNDGDGEPMLTMTIVSQVIEKKLAVAVNEATGNNPLAIDGKVKRTWLGLEAKIIFNRVLTADQRGRLSINLTSVAVKRQYNDILKDLIDFWR